MNARRCVRNNNLASESDYDSINHLVDRRKIKASFQQQRYPIDSIAPTPPYLGTYHTCNIRFDWQKLAYLTDYATGSESKVSLSLIRLNDFSFQTCFELRNLIILAKFITQQVSRCVYPHKSYPSDFLHFPGSVDDFQLFDAEQFHSPV